jgi:hypothetical protein
MLPRPQPRTEVPRLDQRSSAPAHQIDEDLLDLHPICEYQWDACIEVVAGFNPKRTPFLMQPEFVSAQFAAT